MLSQSQMYRVLNLKATGYDTHGLSNKIVWWTGEYRTQGGQTMPEFNVGGEYFLIREWLVVEA